MAKPVVQIFVGFVNLNTEHDALYWKFEGYSVKRD